MASHSSIQNNKIKIKSTIPFKLDVTVEGNQVVDLPEIHGRVYVSDRDTTTNPNNPTPAILNGKYYKLTNLLTDSEDVVWDPVKRQIQFNWKADKHPSDQAALTSGIYYI